MPFDMTLHPAHPLNSGLLRRKVAIIGAISAFGLKADVPWDDPEWEVWGMNAIPTLTPDGRFRADRWFEMHQRCAQTEDDLVWIRKCPLPLYVPDVEMAVLNPNAVVFPLDAIERVSTVYWACTLAYQLALAWWDRFQEVRVYGVDFSLGDDRERTVEWACASYWIGFLRAKGISVWTPSVTWLARHAARYGVEYQAEREDVRRYVSAHRPCGIVEDWGAPRDTARIVETPSPEV